MRKEEKGAENSVFDSKRDQKQVLKYPQNSAEVNTVEDALKFFCGQMLQIVDNLANLAIRVNTLEGVASNNARVLQNLQQVVGALVAEKSPTPKNKLN
jgi:hypothetical protein